MSAQTLTSKVFSFAVVLTYPRLYHLLCVFSEFVECKEKIQAVSCGDDIVTLLSERGTVFCVDRLPRVRIFKKQITVLQSAAHSTVVVYATDGQVYTWGQGSRGQLGLGEGTFTDSSPQQLRALSAMPLVQIAAGGEQSFALSVSGGVFSWGRNDCGQLGLGDTTGTTAACYICLCLILNFKLCCMFFEKVKLKCVMNSKEVYSFGCRDQGQLGHGDMSNHSVPLPVELPEGNYISGISEQTCHCDFSTDGQVYTWGQGSRGQLGLGEGIFTDSSPQQLRALSAMPLVQIAAGGEQSFALSVSGGVFSWGRNDCGQLGLGDTTDRNTPTHVDYLNMKKTIHVSCGKDHTTILTKVSQRKVCGTLML
uniref:Uncharacterized protein n=1 Tax=Mastacembelus armatus TaxID=205130 RepID=A0A3Q3MMS6_9TELE